MIDFTVWGVGVGRLIAVGIILLTTFIIERLVRFALNRSIDKKTENKKAKKTGFIFAKYFISISIYIAGISVAIMMIPPLEKLAISLFAGAGIIAIVIGFASQQAVSNIVSGVFIAIFKPFRIGDTIKFGERIGVVEDITLRHTVVRNFENKRYVVPNSIMGNETIENYQLEDEKICRLFEVGISYDSDIDLAMKIIKEEAIKHPDFLDNRTSEELVDNKDAVIVRVMSLGDFSVNLRAWIWANNASAAFRLGTDLNKSVKERFDKEGVEIPFPYRTLVQKKDVPKPKKLKQLKPKKNQ